MTLSAAELARTIDHTLLKPEATREQIDMLCDEAQQYGFAAVCVNPVYVQRVATRLARDVDSAGLSTRPAVASVAGFPLGANVTGTKVEEARRAIGDGATEIDMVVSVGALIDGDEHAVCADIEAVADVVHRACRGAILKVILECGVLTAEQIVRGCRCCINGGADFVKTSTGLHPSGGATVEQVRLLKQHASGLRVKASGGIRTAAAARAMIEAGASRIGTSAGVSIIEELRGAVP
ncbi:MAG: deoxyribose-phosphate aldolase [Planctomycetes bacterium]|nr:deoxyribose-phosphate aldolase [Planctomycetota bacterium]